MKGNGQSWCSSGTSLGEGRQIRKKKKKKRKRKKWGKRKKKRKGGAKRSSKRERKKKWKRKRYPESTDHKEVKQQGLNEIKEIRKRKEREINIRDNDRFIFQY